MNRPPMLSCTNSKAYDVSRRNGTLRVESERGTDLVRGGTGGSVIESLGVETETEGDLDTGAEGLGVTKAEDTGVVDLGLNERGVVEVSLGTDLEVDLAGGGLGVVNSLGTSLNVLGDLVVVRGRVGGEVAEGVEGDGVVSGRVTDGGGVSSDGTGENVVSGLTTDKEALSADDGVGSEGRTLCQRGREQRRYVSSSCT